MNFVANSLTGLRLLAVPVFAYWMALADAGAARAAALLLAAAIVTDVLDGPMARRAGRESGFGRAFDHGTDFLFVTAGLSAGVVRGVFPWLLPVLIAIAFVQYVLDSYWLRRERELRMSSLGRVNGVLYFFPLGGDLLGRLGVFRALGLELLEPAVWWLCWLLVATTLLSILDRALALSREARDSHAAGTAGRSPH